MRTRRADLPSARGERLWGTILQTVVVGCGLWVLGVSVLAALLSGVGAWRPWLVLPLAALLFAGALWAARRLPARPLPQWSALLLVTLVVAFTVWAGATHSEQVLPRRDAGSNFQAANALAEFGTRVIDIDPAELGGPEVLAMPGVTIASPGFYSSGSPQAPQVQPQFLIGPAAVLSLGQWIGGASGQFLVPALAGGCVLLAMGLLTGATVGARWAPLGAALTGLLFPVLHVSRATYSEPLALVCLGAGLLALLVAAREGDRALDQGPRWWSPAVLAGLLIGGTVLVRIDGLRDAVLLLPAAAVLIARGLRWPWRLCAGMAVGVAAGLLAAVALSGHYLATIAASLVPLLALGVAFGMTPWLAHWGVQRRLRMPPALAGRLPALVAGLVILVGLALASRPLWLIVRQDPNDPGSRYVAGMQLRQGLAVDGGRTYAEQTVAWLSWWIGPIALVVALIALAACAHRVAAAWRDREPLPAWFVPLFVVTGSSLLTLQRPGITPDHPWAERRLVIVLPFVVILVLAAIATSTRWLGRRWPSVAAAAWALALTAAVAVPAAAATWPHRQGRIEAGELAAVRAVCAAFDPQEVALMTDSRAANEWPQVLRGCGVQALSTSAAVRADPAAMTRLVDELAPALEVNGQRLVLLAAQQAAPISDLGAQPEQVVGVTVREDERVLTHRPEGTTALPLTVWIGRR